MIGDLSLVLYNFSSNFAWFFPYLNWILTGLIVLVVLSVLGRRRVFFTALISGVLAFLITWISRFLVPVSRPFVKYGFEPLIQHSATPSFPSAHAMVSFAIAVSLLCYNRRIGVIALLLACMLSFIRVMAGLHYFIDFFVGGVLGTIIALLVFYILDK